MKNCVDQLLFTTKPQKIVLISSHERPKAGDIYAVISCHVETVVLMSRVEGK
jgi:hypothetical protein